MYRGALVTLNMRELDRLKVIQAVVETGLKPGRAAERLGVTVRQVQRLVDRYRESGAAGLASRKRGRLGNRRLDEALARRALTIIRDRYADFGPTLACEKLWECHGIRLAKETVRRLMTDAGLWVPRRQRPPKIYQPRARRACLGELIQIDGSEHRWFEARAPQCTLLVYVDDATSRLMMLHFTATESTFSYFEATRAYLERYGKPVALYSDKASVFRSTNASKTGRSVTHFGRAMYELNIDTFCANSSSAKGRVERAHLTLQDRLVKEMRLRGINTVEDANAYAPSFIATYNARFAKPPLSDFDAHRPLRDDEDLDQLLTWRETRRVSKSLTVLYDRVLYLLDDTGQVPPTVADIRRKPRSPQAKAAQLLRMVLATLHPVDIEAGAAAIAISPSSLQAPPQLVHSVSIARSAWREEPTTAPPATSSQIGRQPAVARCGSSLMNYVTVAVNRNMRRECVRYKRTCIQSLQVFFSLSVNDSSEKA